MQESDFSNVTGQDRRTSSSREGSFDRGRTSARQTVAQTFGRKAAPPASESPHPSSIKSTYPPGSQQGNLPGSQDKGGLHSSGEAFRAEPSRTAALSSEIPKRQPAASKPLDMQAMEPEAPAGEAPSLHSQGIRTDMKYGCSDLKPGEMACRAATPYPPVQAACKHAGYACAILDNLGGQISEMTLIGQYFYSSLLTREYREIYEAFRQISLSEMHHLDIFGTLAAQLGADPRLLSRNPRTGRCRYWDGGLVRYSSSVKDLLSCAITMEREACSKYLKQASWIQDQNVCDNLKRIAADEQMHAELFTRLYHKYC